MQPSQLFSFSVGWPNMLATWNEAIGKWLIDKAPDFIFEYAIKPLGMIVLVLPKYVLLPLWKMCDVVAYKIVVK